MDHGATPLVQAGRPIRVFPLCVVFLLFASPLLAWMEDEPEEPDYFFLTGGPYTQKKNSPQFILANQWTWTGPTGLRRREYSAGGRFEIGLTDRWEADFEFGAVHFSEEFPGAALSATGVADFLVGARYRLLDESFAPVTLTLGPQLVLPAASRDRGLGNGEPGYAIDITAAKDWGNAVFLVASLNLLWTPNVPSHRGPPGDDADLTDIGAAVALGWRAVERSAESGVHHDIHIFLESAWEQTESSENGASVPSRGLALAPGIRYGFTGVGGSLTEVGVALPVGLNGAAPDWGWILQVQFELPPLR